ncbi:hypothetical protein ACEPAI_5728 [Sanghuangporus weigelae]
MSLNQVHQNNRCRVNSRVLSILSARLKSLEGDVPGSPDSDDLGLSPLASECNLISRNELLAEIDELQTLESARQAFLSLSDGLAETISSRRKAIMPAALRAGFATLPNETLLQIFEKMLMDRDKGPFRSALILTRFVSSVCRRFRDAILKLPEVWSYLDLRVLGEESLQEHLVRSKKMPLYVQFKYKDNMVRVLQQAFEHKDRWTYLDAHFTLKFSMSMRRPFSRWRFPRVDALLVRDALPTSRFFDYSRLTTFMYTSHRSDLGIDGTFLRSLTEFLGSATSLRALKLDLSQIRVLGPEDELKVVLPFVTHFSIMNLDWSRRYRFGEADSPLQVEDFSCILYAFHLPNVQKISVSMCVPFYARFSLHDWIYASFSPTDKLRSLTAFEFMLRWWDTDATKGNAPVDIPIDEFFRSFPRLRELSLDAEDCSCSCVNRHRVRLDRLRTFRIRNWNSNGRELYNLLCQMDGLGASFQEIRIESNRVLRKKLLRDRFPKANIEVAMPYLAA